MHASRTPAPVPNALYSPGTGPAARVHVAPHPLSGNHVLVTYRQGGRLTTRTVHRSYISEDETS